MPENPTAEEPVEIRRSTRRRRTLSAQRRDGRIIVSVPAHLSPTDEARQVEALVAKLRAKLDRPAFDDTELAERARVLSERYLDDRAVPTSIRWVDNPNSRWGSCTTTTGAIRISSRVRTMPDYVVDLVVLHELAHLIESGHGQAFKRLMARYPHRLKAEGFLEGVSWQQR